MCGIVGYVGSRPAEQIILGGLRKLEYRGYDSAGMSLLSDGEIHAVRAVGNLDRLEAALARQPVAATAITRPATIGIGHTRWATHGRVSEENAHPLVDNASRIHVVVNGIVGNYMALKDRLLAQGTTFATETDAEVIAHLIASNYRDTPEGAGELAAAVPAFLSHTNQVQYVENGEIVILRADSVEICSAGGVPHERLVETIDWDEETAEKGGYDTFMLKEIHEQAQALAETIADRTASGDRVELADPGVFDEEILQGVERVAFVACGSAYHAGLLGRYALEEWARIRADVDVASEYRYRDPVLGPGDLVVGISQSGE